MTGCELDEGDGIQWKHGKMGNTRLLLDAVPGTLEEREIETEMRVPGENMA